MTATMNINEQLNTLISQYCDFSAEEIRPEHRFREDLGFSSLDFMSLLGEMEDTFDLEADEDQIMEITTVGQAQKLLAGLMN